MKCESCGATSYLSFENDGDEYCVICQELLDEAEKENEPEEDL